MKNQEEIKPWTARELALHHLNEVMVQREEFDRPRRGRLYGMDGVLLRVQVYGLGIGTYKIKEVTPIKRRLESLTEEEAQECYRIVWGRAWPTEPDDWHKHHTPSEPYTCLDAWWDDVPDGGFEVSFARHHKGSPAVWQKLLEWGFDLNGDIDTGRAIDKATLTV